ncbi:MAG: HYR domain-containing protein [Acidobacteria bacterium]|nr:HYR domain-containing protein [Acidobacteriota bacterium]
MSKVKAHKHIPFPRHLSWRSTTTRIITLLTLIGFFLFLGLVCWRSAWLTSQAAYAATISGTVFQDYNANGTQDTTKTIPNTGSGSVGVAVDQGIQGVVVTAYGPNGAVAGTATTDSQGNYTINATGNGPYRVEFTGIPTGFKPGPAGPNSKTTVQFVSDGIVTNASLGLVIPQEYCQDNPTLVTGCYIGGDQNIAMPVVVSFPYAAGSTRTTGFAPFTDFDSPPHGEEALANQVGTTWGIAYSRSTKQLYVSAFMKKHAGFGMGGTGAIYKIDRANPGSVSIYANLNTIFGANTAGPDPHNQSDFDRDNGNVTWDAVGKISLGQMAISDDEKKLYVMNLADRSLYEIPLDATPSSGTIRRRPVPTNPPGCPSASDVRPFSVVFENNQLYVGMVCSAESTISAGSPDGNPSQMQAYVYTANPVTLDYSASPVFQAPLNYTRRCADSAQLGPGSCFSAAWRVWSPVFRNIGTEGRAIYPQPMLTDLAFDGGNLIMGLRDRAGDQLGTETLDNASDNLRYYGVTAGDILRACGNPTAGWTLESNGRCGGAGAAPQNTGEGPGNGEFYFGDVTQPFTDEVSMGGLVQVPGFPDVALNVLDPIPLFNINSSETLFDGGTRWLNDSTGGSIKNHRIYDGQRIPLVLFGKANGLSDLVALCDPAGIEIGNRIWQDTNGNGVQDAGEPPIGGLSVTLFKNGVQVGTAVTNSAGEFYFNASNVAGGVQPDMAYEIRVDKSQAALNGFTLTVTKTDSGPNSESRDSDATMVGNSAVISLNTGGPGDNNHTFDIGFIPQGGGLTIICPRDIEKTTKDDEEVVIYPPPIATQGASVTCSPRSGGRFPVGTTKVTCTATLAGNSVSCSFNIEIIKEKKKDNKCHKPCLRPPKHHLLNLKRLPDGLVMVGGLNGKTLISARENIDIIAAVLRGSPTRFGKVTPMQRFNRQFVALQLSLNAEGAAAQHNFYWSMLNCFRDHFSHVILSNNFEITPMTMLGDLLAQAKSAVVENHTADLTALAGVLELLNGNDQPDHCKK